MAVFSPQNRRRLARAGGWTIQLGLLAAAGLITLAPPARGVMLIVPVLPGEGSVARLAVAGDARILGEGPVHGSLYVIGSRSTLLPRATASGAIIFGGRYIGCAGLEAGYDQISV